jgi:hypothetical protein
VTITFYRDIGHVSNYFVWSVYNNETICFCNWNITTGPSAGLTKFQGLSTTYYQQLLDVGMLFCPSEAVKVNRILLDVALSHWEVV